MEEGFDPARRHAQETVFTIGNGRFATRGAFEEGDPGDRAATLAHGIFAPHPFGFTELANLPDWTALDITIDGERFAMSRGQVVTCRRTLDLRTGLLVREVDWRSPGGSRSRLVFERFVSKADPWLAAVRVTVTPLDRTQAVTVRALLDAHPANDGRAHLAWVAQEVGAEAASLGVRVEGGDAGVGLAMRARVTGADAEREAWDVRGTPALVASWTAARGRSVTVEKTVALATTREVESPADAAAAHLGGLKDATFDGLLAASAEAWREVWAVSDVRIEGDRVAQLAIRHSILQLLIAGPPADDQVSIGARTLSGFGYLGHVFWDTELFMLPFFTLTQPAIARNLLSYRWHRLPGARHKATAGGFDGAQFPWESAATGDEVTPTWLPHRSDPSRLVRIWTGDIEIHVSACVAHAVMSYWRATGDDAFMAARGAELVIETARFWASRAEWDEALERYRFRDVIGPDEYHEHVDDDAFTNHLAAWHLRAAAELVPWLGAHDPARARAVAGDVAARAALSARFREVAERIHVAADPETGLIEQFAGYLGLQDVDPAAYASERRSMQAILGIEGVAQTQVIKQPDVLMLACLLPDLFDERTLAVNYDYYTARTDHAYGSSLGPAIQALLAARSGAVEDAYRSFMLAAGADLGDVRGNAGDGIHGASAGGLWQALVFGFAGVRFAGDEVTTDPRLPAHWQRLSFSLVRHGRVVEVDVRGATREAGGDPDDEIAA